MVDPSSFLPRCLLNTMYKLYSGILENTLTRISKENNWASIQQKFFYRVLEENNNILFSSNLQ